MCFNSRWFAATKFLSCIDLRFSYTQVPYKIYRFILKPCSLPTSRNVRYSESESGIARPLPVTTPLVPILLVAEGRLDHVFVDFSCT